MRVNPAELNGQSVGKPVTFKMLVGDIESHWTYLHGIIEEICFGGEDYILIRTKGNKHMEALNDLRYRIELDEFEEYEVSWEVS